MRMAHLFNTRARFARQLKALYAGRGVHDTITFIAIPADRQRTTRPSSCRSDEGAFTETIYA